MGQSLRLEPMQITLKNRENVYIVEVKIEDTDKFDLIAAMSGSVKMKLGKKCFKLFI